MCANLFDIVNAGQHPDASVVEDGEFLRQFLLAGLDHSPRHGAALRLNLQFNPGEKYKHKNITSASLRSLWSAQEDDEKKL